MRVPYDEIAEEEVVGVVVGSRHGAGLILDRGITVEDFYKPLHRSLFATVEHLAELVDDDERARIAAEKAGADLEEVVALVRNRCVQWDEAGTFCRRVQHAARRRDAMQACSDAYNALGEGADVDEVLAWVRPPLEALVGAS